MERIQIRTRRLVITELDESMAQSLHRNSLDEDTRRLVPDEVFETAEAAHAAILHLMVCYRGTEGPFVYPILLEGGEPIGYVQAVSTAEGWEIGYHIAAGYRGRGYAAEAVEAFLPVIMERLRTEDMLGVCVGENAASRAVLERCGFALEYRGDGMYQGNVRDVCRYRYRRR